MIFYVFEIDYFLVILFNEIKNLIIIMLALIYIFVFNKEYL
jgi:hypothetical protein